MTALPFSRRLGVEAIRGDCTQTAQELYFFICPKSIMPVWVRLIFDKAEFAVYNQMGRDFGHPQ